MKYIDENTIGVMVIMGSTYTGAFEDVKGMSDLRKCLKRSHLSTVIRHTNNLLTLLLQSMIFMLAPVLTSLYMSTEPRVDSSRHSHIPNTSGRSLFLV
jgi:hypothetical protein